MTQDFKCVTFDILIFKVHYSHNGLTVNYSLCFNNNFWSIIFCCAESIVIKPR